MQLIKWRIMSCVWLFNASFSQFCSAHVSIARLRRSSPRWTRVFGQKLRKQWKIFQTSFEWPWTWLLCGNDFTSRSARFVLQYYVRCSVLMKRSAMTRQTSRDLGWQSRKILSISLIKRKSCCSAETSGGEAWKVHLNNCVSVAKSGHMRWPTFPLFPTWIFTFELVFENNILWSLWKWLLSLARRNRSEWVSRLCGVIHRKWKRLHLIYANDMRQLHAKNARDSVIRHAACLRLDLPAGKKKYKHARWEFCNEHRTKQLDWWQVPWPSAFTLLRWWN